MVGLINQSCNIIVPFVVTFTSLKILPQEQGSIWLMFLSMVILVSLFDLWSVNKRYLNNENFIDKTFTENPFQTENSELLMQKVGENRNLQTILANANVNKTL